jgi:uncharacterized protein (TIGR02284 family)
MSPVEILDRLIQVCIDSEKRYEHAASDVGRGDLERFFRQQAANRKAAADELQARRAKLGVLKEESGSLAGMMDRIEMDLSVIHSMGDSGVVDWCRQDAEKVEAEYNQILNSSEVPADLRPVLERQSGEVRSTLSELNRVLQAYGGPRS